MKLKDIIKFIKKSDIRKNVNSDELFPDCGNVKIEDKELALIIGEWLGKQIHSTNSNMYLENAGRRLNEKNVSIISKRFANILKIAGIEDECVINNYVEETNWFECKLSNGDVAYIKLDMGVLYEKRPQITISYNGITKNFEYIEGYIDEDENIPDRLYLKYYEKDVDECGTKFRFEADDYAYIGKASYDNVRLEVNLGYPVDLDNSSSENIFVDTDKLEHVITTNCEYPFDICHIYKRIIECMKIDPINFYIDIKAIRCEDDKEYVTDGIMCHGNTVIELTITKRWRTITVKSNGAWNFDSLEWKISKNVHNNISYTLTNGVADESMIADCPTPAEVYKEVKEDVEAVKKLSKSLVEHNKR